ncbi:MAG TPA: LppP/LprE family lipoprotein [Chloroflexota bacterium]|nr:LppP/LprE family lipoprotein [Chloroflexota bacterium]
MSAVIALLAWSTTAAFAQSDGPGAWLEVSPPANWNVPGASVPVAPPEISNTESRCRTQERPPESPEEDQLVGAGWHLFNAARVGWGIRLVDALVDYDGMCRPNQFNGFLFADGQFAGVISPTPMDSRTDGVGRVIDVRGPDTLNAQFVRYTATDPLCCPSSSFAVDYRVDRNADGGPLLVPFRSTPLPRPN